jgi:NAD(P)-dependent dehydrogenase (short-subunit alcohol dehydrogenase family)
MIVTGGGRGIGAATVLLAAEQGFKVCVNYRQDKASADSLAKKVGGIAVQADVSSEADVIRLFETTDNKIGRVTALVNNAGIVDLGTRVEKMTAARIARMFAINVTGSFLCAREATKGAIDTFTIGLSKEVGAEGIRVNAVRPGIIRTEIHASSGDPARLERIGASAPLGRPGEAEEVARTILWLLSDEASYLSGALVDVSGGR